MLSPLLGAACSYRIAFGPHSFQKVLTRQGSMPMPTEFKQTTLCTAIGGLSPHAAVRGGADDRKRWNSCACTSPGSRWPPNACSPTPLDRWCCS